MVRHRVFHSVRDGRRVEGYTSLAILFVVVRAISRDQSGTHDAFDWVRFDEQMVAHRETSTWNVRLG